MSEGTPEWFLFIFGAVNHRIPRGPGRNDGVASGAPSLSHSQVESGQQKQKRDRLNQGTTNYGLLSLVYYYGIKLYGTTNMVYQG